MQAASQAIALVDEWQDVSVEDALYMLSGAFKQPGIRDAAVRVLKAKVTDDKLYEVMNQLVLCVRHDGPSSNCPVSGVHTLMQSTFVETVYKAQGNSGARYLHYTCRLHVESLLVHCTPTHDMLWCQYCMHDLACLSLQHLLTVIE